MPPLLIPRILIVLVAGVNAALSLILGWQRIALSEAGIAEGVGSWIVLWVLGAGVPLALAVWAAVRMSRGAAFGYGGWSLLSAFLAFFFVWWDLVDSGMRSGDWANTVAAWHIWLSLIGVVVGLVVGLLLSRSASRPNA